MFKFLLLLCFALTTVCIHAQTTPYMINQVLLGQKCQKTSPLFSNYSMETDDKLSLLIDMKYGYENIDSTPRALFCEKYAHRSCCNTFNFQELELK